MKTLFKIILLMTLLIGMAVACKVADADMRKVDKLRHFYSEHGLDFFGDLIAGEADILSDERKHAKLELLADDARTRALSQLDGLMRSAKGEMLAELLLRKATLLSDRARTAAYFQNNPFKASKLKAPPEYLRSSIAVFQQLERQFPTHPKMDIVIFTIAYNYGELRSQEQSYVYYSRLVSRYPASPLVGDARLAIAEIEFDRRKFAAALAQLKEIVSSNHPRLKNFALYKMAWTYYNMGELGQAMASLERVIDGVNNASAVGRARLELRKEALHDLVAYYAERPEANAATDAADYFNKVGRTPDGIAAEYASARAKRIEALAAKQAPLPDEDSDELQVTEPQELLLRLTQVYRDQGKHQNAMTVAGILLDQLPRHPRTVALYRLRAEMAEKLRHRDRVVAELERLAHAIESDLPAVDKYADGLPATAFGPLAETFATAKPAVITWAAAPVAPEAGKLSAYQKALAKIGFDAFNDFSTFFHGEWSKTQDQATARFATATYDLAVHATLEPWRGQALDTAFELRRRRAQLRFALKQWDQAAVDFHWLTLHMVTPEATVTSNIQGEIGALEGFVKDSKLSVSAAKDGSTPLAPAHQRLVAAYDIFLALYAFDKAKRPTSADILAASAHLMKEYGHADDALARLRFYSSGFSDQKDAVPATRDILAILNQASRWQELRDFTAATIKSGTYAKTPVAAELSRSNEYASLRLLESLEKGKDWEKASSEFAAFAKEHPESQFVSQALIKSANAALEQSKQSKDPQAAIARLEAATEASDGAVRLQAWLGLEPYYRKAFQWKTLSGLYEKVLGLKPDEQARRGARANLEQVQKLDATSFSRAGEQLVESDPELARLLGELSRFETAARDYRALRFVKSNNNPQRNFKQKADAQAALTAKAEAVADNAPKSLRGAAATWAGIAKAELVLELADTLDTSALPAVLKAATDNDRKAYRDTLASQITELRGAAQKLAEEAASRITQLDSPLALEDRLNKLLERVSNSARVARADFRAVWARRPQLADPGQSTDDRQLRALGLKLLKSEDAGEIRKLESRLAAEYVKGGEYGYAYAITAVLRDGGAKDELAEEAARTQFLIDSARLPARLRSAVQDNTFTERDRWDLARWLAGRRDSLGSEQKAWIDEALTALLRSKAADIKIIQASRGND